MLTLNDSALNDNQIIWVIKIDTDTPIYLSTAKDGITLDANFYDGKVLFKDSLSDGGKAIDISYGGGIGSVGSFDFSIARYNLNSLTNGFFNEFYPTIEAGPVVMPYLIARVVSVGFLWEGATTEAEITWFFYGYIDDYSYDSDKITLSCLEYAELENIELPYYKVQKDFDDKVSYFPKAKENSFGSPIPILYGDFTAVDQEYNIYTLAPTILVDINTYTFLLSSHWLQTSADALYKYLDGADTYMKLFSAQEVSTDSYNGLKYTLMNTPVQVYGKVYLHFGGIGSYSDEIDVVNTRDDDDSSYNTLTRVSAGGDKRMSLILESDLSTSELGILSSTTADIGFYATIGSADALTIGYRLFYRLVNSSQPPAQTAGTTVVKITDNVDFGDYIGTVNQQKYNTNLPWTIEELQGMQYVIQNESANDVTYIIRVYNAYLYLNNIVLVSIVKGKRPVTKRLRGFGYRFSGRIKMPYLGGG